jgi:hypothetical protein
MIGADGRDQADSPGAFGAAAPPELIFEVRRASDAEARLLAMEQAEAIREVIEWMAHGARIADYALVGAGEFAAGEGHRTASSVSCRAAGSAGLGRTLRRWVPRHDESVGWRLLTGPCYGEVSC